MVTHIRLYSLLLLLCLLVLPKGAGAFDIHDMRFGVHPDKTRLVMELSDVSDYRVFTLDAPYRIVIDLPRFQPRFDPASRIDQSATALIGNIRWGHLNPQISRMVVDLKTPIDIGSAFLLPAKSDFPPRLVIDFKKTDSATFLANKGNVFGTLTVEDIQKAAVAQKANPANKPSNNYAQPSGKAAAGQVVKAGAKAPPIPPTRAKAYRAQKPVIIIDPGHGGIDPGAIGHNGVYEKDIVLKLSHELRKQLEKTGRFKVKMTRQDDRFLRLQDRVAYARRHKGDLFVSVHADSLERKNVSGASVYTLSERASDAQTAKLARRENQADLIAGIDLGAEEKEVANILIDLAMRDTMNQSAFFANTLVSEMEKSDIHTLTRPHRFAGFAVLKAPDIPSVLVEAGFLSNRKEAARLSKASYRRDVAKAIVSGIMAYYDKVEQNRRS